MFLDFGIFVVSLVALLVAADVFVNQVVVIARRMHVSTMVIGLTVVAIGTSLPELAASIAASVSGHTSMVVGNVLGSNICNIGLILGLPAMFIPIHCHRHVVTREGYLMLLVTFVFWGIGLTVVEVGAVIGFFLTLGFAAFVYFAFQAAKQAKDVEVVAPGIELDSTEDVEKKSIFGIILLFLVSLVVILASSKFLIDSGVLLATDFGISEEAIALTLIAFGTSVPELSVSFAAARKDQGDVLVGNIIGSNISNILLVVGVSSMVTPINLDTGVSLTLDLPITVIFSLLMVLFLLSKKGVTRTKGACLLLLYLLGIWRVVALQ